ncbi:conserved hypothetical protein, putative amidase [Cenarchaeum symbiosum A]|uniref:Creatininase n=1 Tax=Cenarchaeum symbiosum (strain A) TaxID=414004 RepID=A0RZA5_CENSY|nr:conserved hypothetical protein, putative amidase [Cenarchaeum symbiosum A]
MNNASDLPDPDLRRMLSGRPAVLPVGSTEQHGAHLPVSTDSDIVSEVAYRVSKKCGYLCMPTIQYGVSFEHSPYLNLSLRGATLRHVVRDIISSMASAGAPAVFVINGHHGNARHLEGLESKRAPRTRVISYWHYLEEGLDHAGDIETSIMLAISDKVRMSRAKKGFVPPELDDTGRERLSKRASRSFIEVTGNGIWGDPRKATAKKGEEMLSRATRAISIECRAWLRAGRNPSRA